MTLALSAYTPLESLLLFQYLSVYGVNHTVFAKISDQLKSNPLIRNASTYEPGRLSPDALRDIFVRLLKEEAKDELQPQGSAVVDGQTPDASPSMRKRKAPSPSLPSTAHALKDQHLIPQLVTKLYARYREYAVKEIRHDERRYAQLNREADEIERGFWDARLQEQINNGQWKEHTHKATAETNGRVMPDDLSSVVAPPLPKSGLAVPEVRPSSVAPVVTRKSKSRSPQPPIAQGLSKAGQPRAEIAVVVPQPAAKASPPPQSQPIAAQGPGLQDAIQPAPRPPSNPTLATSSVGSPSSPYTTTKIPQPPYAGPPGGPQVPNPGQYGQQQPVPLPTGYAPHLPQQHPHGYMPPPPSLPQVYPHVQGRVLPPFQVAPQTPQAQHTAMQSSAPNTAPHRHVPPPTLLQRPAEQDRRSTLPARAFQLSMPDAMRDELLILLGTPVSAKAKSAFSTPRTVTTPWKSRSVGGPGAAKRATSPEQLRGESPIRDEPSKPKGKPGRPSRAAAAARQSERLTPHELPEGAKPEPAAPPARPRGNKGRRGRGGSVASSVVGSSTRGRTRSHSIISQSSVGNESATAKKVKPEPSTPAENAEAMSTVEDTPTVEQTKRGRIPQPSGYNKRKRGQRAASDASDVATPANNQAEPPAPPKIAPNMILAVRNFPRLAASTMDDIQSHKHASLFSKPVRKNAAEGYYEIIKRPTSLKDIRAAISHGARIVNQLAADLAPAPGSSAASSRDASTVLLPISEDLVPPLGIVNSAQLEREILRMLANAALFSPGEDESDFVEAAREMLASVAVSLATFRSTERSMASSAVMLEPRKDGDGTAAEAVETPVAEEEAGPEGSPEPEPSVIRVGKRRRGG